MVHRRGWPWELAAVLAAAAVLAGVLTRQASRSAGAVTPRSATTPAPSQVGAQPPWSILSLAFEFASIDANGAAAPQFVQREEVEDASAHPVRNVVVRAMPGAARIRAYVDGRAVSWRRKGGTRVAIPLSLIPHKRRWIALTYVLETRGPLPWTFSYTLRWPVSGGIYVGTLARDEPYLMVRSDQFRRDPAADNRTWRGWQARQPSTAGETLHWTIVADPGVPYPASAIPSPPPQGHSFLPRAASAGGGV